MLKLNPIQRLTLAFAIIAFVASVVYPPWQRVQMRGNFTVTQSVGFGWLLGERTQGPNASVNIVIDWDVLLLVWALLVVVVFGTIWLLQGSNLSVERLKPELSIYQRVIHTLFRLLLVFDTKRARAKYRKLAEEGDAMAQYRVGTYYTVGVPYGVMRSLIKAYKWFDLAAAQGVESAAFARDYYAKELLPEQLAAAQHLIKEWRDVNGSK